MKVNYKDVINYIIRNGFSFTGNSGEDIYFFKDYNKIICYVTPHKGTDFKHLLRAEINEDFDKWGNCQYEVLFETKRELLNCICELIDLSKVEEMEVEG